MPSWAAYKILTMLILAGRPSMGKTALATSMAFAASPYAMSGGAEGAVTAVLLEMSHDQLTTRILADQASISSE